MIRGVFWKFICLDPSCSFHIFAQPSTSSYGDMNPRMASRFNVVSSPSTLRRDHDITKHVWKATDSWLVEVSNNCCGDFIQIWGLSYAIPNIYTSYHQFVYSPMSINPYSSINWGIDNGSILWKLVPEQSMIETCRSQVSLILHVRRAGSYAPILGGTTAFTEDHEIQLSGKTCDMFTRSAAAF